MKHLYNLAFAAFLVLVLSGCSDEGDSPAPAFHLSVVWEGHPDFLHQVENASLQSTKLDEIIGVKFYLGDVLIVEDMEAPFSISLNTELYGDGVYPLRVIAQTRNNQEVENIQQITISNILLKMILPADYFPKGDSDFIYAWWIYLTDEHSNLIGSVQSGNTTEEVVWRRPKGFTKYANLNILNTLEIASLSHKYHGVTTYLNYPLNEFKPQPNKIPDLTSSKSLNLNFINDSGLGSIQNYAYVRGSERTLVERVSTSSLKAIPIQSDNDKMLVLQQTVDETTALYGDYRYHLVSGPAGTTKNVAYSQSLNPKLIPITISTPVKFALASSIWNIDGDYVQIPGYSTSKYTLPTYMSPVNNEASVAFVILSGDYSQGAFELIKPAAEVGTKVNLPVHNMAPTYLNKGSFSLQSNGEADVYYSTWLYQPGNDRGLYISVYGQHENTTIHRPVIPAEILADQPDLIGMAENLRVTRVTSIDYAKLTGYAPYLKELMLPSLTQDEFLNLVGGYSSHTLNVSLEGQRIGAELDNSTYSKPQHMFFNHTPFVNSTY